MVEAMTSAIERAKELFYELKPECQAHSEGCKGCEESITDIAALLTDIRLEALRECEDKYDALDVAPFEAWLDSNIHALEAERRKAGGTQ
jgi:hypothetical protein